MILGGKGSITALCDRTWVACRAGIQKHACTVGWNVGIACVANDLGKNRVRAKCEEKRRESFLSFFPQLSLWCFALVSFFARPKHSKRKRILRWLECGLSFLNLNLTPRVLWPHQCAITQTLSCPFIVRSQVTRQTIDHSKM